MEFAILLHYSTEIYSGWYLSHHRKKPLQMVWERRDLLGTYKSIKGEVYGLTNYDIGDKVLELTSDTLLPKF